MAIQPVACHNMYLGAVFLPAFSLGLNVDNAPAKLFAVTIGDGDSVSRWKHKPASMKEEHADNGLSKALPVQQNQNGANEGKYRRNWQGKPPPEDCPDGQQSDGEDGARLMPTP